MNKDLSKIIRDNRSGSEALLIKLALLFSKQKGKSHAVKILLDEAQDSFSSFGIINTYLKDVRKALLKKDPDLLDEAVSKPIKIEHLIYEAIYENVCPFIKELKTLFTFSNSRTILEIICIHKKRTRKRIKVFITESRPVNEGRILAEKLLAENINVEFGVDASMGSFIRKSDAVFIGADKLFPDGAVINKIGSLQAAVMCHYYKKPFYVFAGSGKLSRSSIIKQNNGTGIWKNEDKRLKIINNYFEKVPGELITKIFTEKE